MSLTTHRKSRQIFSYATGFHFSLTPGSELVCSATHRWDLFSSRFATTRCLRAAQTAQVRPPFIYGIAAFLAVDFPLLPLISFMLENIFETCAAWLEVGGEAVELTALAYQASKRAYVTNVSPSAPP
jgi:hypothetical protein